MGWDKDLKVFLIFSFIPYKEKNNNIVIKNKICNNKKTHFCYVDINGNCRGLSQPGCCLCCGDDLQLVPR